MDDINYFKDIINDLSIHDYNKIIILLIFIIKQDNDVLLESGMSQNDFIKKLYKGCKKILNQN